MTAKVSLVDPLSQFDQLLGWPFATTHVAQRPCNELLGGASRGVADRWEYLRRLGKIRTDGPRASRSCKLERRRGDFLAARYGQRRRPCGRLFLVAGVTRVNEFSRLVIDKKGNTRIPWEDGED